MCTKLDIYVFIKETNDKHLTSRFNMNPSQVASQIADSQFAESQIAESN